MPFLFKKTYSELYRSSNLTGFDAFCTDFQSLSGVVVGYTYCLKVRQPPSLRLRSTQCPRAGVLMTYVLTELRTFTADIAYSCHYMNLLDSFEKNE